MQLYPGNPEEKILTWEEQRNISLSLSTGYVKNCVTNKKHLSLELHYGIIPYVEAIYTIPAKESPSSQANITFILGSFQTLYQKAGFLGDKML